MNLLDVVYLRVDVPDKGLKAGAVGTIVEEWIHNGITEAYEVEFVDDEGKTFAVCAIAAGALEPV